LNGCKNFEINNLKITKCKSDYGGAMFFSSSTGKMSNSELSDNTSGFGGGFYSNNTACNILLYNTKILNNTAVGNSGGGIYAIGELTIDGDKSNVSNNVADTYGGGIMVKTKGLINNCIICNNKALMYDGGGVVADGELTLNNAKIYKNWCNRRGGGVYYENKNAIFIYDKDKIRTIVYDNKANKGGNDFYPELE
jgi:predicted outer membrane repeat protein